MLVQLRNEESRRGETKFMIERQSCWRWGRTFWAFHTFILRQPYGTMLHRLLRYWRWLFSLFLLHSVQQLHHSLEISWNLNDFLVFNFEIIDLCLQFAGFTILSLLHVGAAPDLVHLPALQLIVFLLHNQIYHCFLPFRKLRRLLNDPLDLKQLPLNKLVHVLS